MNVLRHSSLTLLLASFALVVHAGCSDAGSPTTAAADLTQASDAGADGAPARAFTPPVVADAGGAAVTPPAAVDAGRASADAGENYDAGDREDDGGDGVEEDSGATEEAGAPLADAGSAFGVACASKSHCSADAPDCFKFNGKGKHCTKTCRHDGDCPAGSGGCNGQRVCKIP